MSERTEAPVETEAHHFWTEHYSFAQEKILLTKKNGKITIAPANSDNYNLKRFNATTLSYQMSRANISNTSFIYCNNTDSNTYSPVDNTDGTEYYFRLYSANHEDLCDLYIITIETFCSWNGKYEPVEIGPYSKFEIDVWRKDKINPIIKVVSVPDYLD